MDAVGAGGECDIEAIVDDDPGAHARDAVAHGANQLDERSGR